MKSFYFSLLLLMLLTTAAAQEAAVPVEQEPHHHVVLKNDSVIVTHVILAPGDTTAYHTHSYDRVAVHLTNGPVTLQQPGQPESEPLPSEIGELSASTRKGEPLTHRVHNVGKIPFEVIDVEILKKPGGSSEPVAQVAAENPSARVYKWTLAPGASSEQHTHTRPYLIMAVTPFKLTMTGQDGKSMTHEVKPGDVHWIEGEAVTHTLNNAGTTEGQIVEVELK
jgi:quercetin dioxygenase-like cupin family protein